MILRRFSATLRLTNEEPDTCCSRGGTISKVDVLVFAPTRERAEEIINGNYKDRLVKGLMPSLKDEGPCEGAREGMGVIPQGYESTDDPKDV